LVVHVVVTFVLSLLAAYGFLLLCCRRAGNPFGPRARAWAVLIVVATAAVSAALGLLLAAASHPSAAYLGLLVPSSLWLTTLAQRDPHLVPFGPLYDRMGDDMEDWCDTRLRAAAQKPQWIAAAANYYYDQVEARIRDERARDELDEWRESIVHKIGVVRLIFAEAPAGEVRDALQTHPGTRDTRRYHDDDPARLAARLESEALNELHLFLAYIYRLGYHKLLIYPFRPPAVQAQPEHV